MAHLRSNALSKKGRRSENQDGYQILRVGDCDFLAVADGMGGAAGGMIASRLALDAAERILQKHLSNGSHPKGMKTILHEVFEEAQKAIAREVEAHQELKGMGTTMTCVLLWENRYLVANLGDSRVYKIGDESLTQITEDHSYIQKYRESEERSQESIAQSMGHLLTKAIDGGNDQPDIFPLDDAYDTLNPGEGFLLCSDGLITDKAVAQDEVFSALLLGSNTREEAAEHLVQYALRSGSKDNITVVIGEYGHFNRRKPVPIGKHHKLFRSSSSASSSKSRAISLVGLLFFLIILFLALAFWKPGFLL